MRFLSAVLFVALTGSVALADDAKPADAQPEATVKAPKQRVPLRVVRMLPETRQVLLFDKTKGTHVVAEVGQDVDGYRVDDIDDDEVTLIAPSGSEVILTAPWHRKADKRADAKKGDPAPQDPYADATSAAPAGPADPYADAADGSSPTSASAATPSTSPTGAPIVAGDNGDRVVSASGAASTASGAPSDPYGDPAVNAFFDAVSSSAPATKPAPTTSKTTKPGKASMTTSSADGAALGAALTGSPAPASTPSATSSATSTPGAPAASPGTAPSPGPTTATIKRADIDAALGDFAGTASTFSAAFTPQGLRFDAVADGSLLAKVGLQKGDVLTTIDGQPLRSLDDAANLYARLPTAHGSTLQVQRAGKPITLRIAIQ